MIKKAVTSLLVTYFLRMWRNWQTCTLEGRMIIDRVGSSPIVRIFIFCVFSGRQNTLFQRGLTTFSFYPNLFHFLLFSLFFYKPMSKNDPLFRLLFAISSNFDNNQCLVATHRSIQLII